ncbi:hypothetical protein ACLMJK_003104 [Lecanora helva]
MDVSPSIAQDFPDLPPFPDNVPTAPLLRLSLEKLLENDEEESIRFFTACKDIGFFYLDLQGTQEGQSLLQDADALFDVGSKLFDLPLEEKQSYDFSAQNSYFGYKGYGTSYIDKTGTLDRNEFYNVSKDTLLSLTPHPLPTPPLLTAHHPLLTSYTHTAHTLTLLLLTHLNTHLRLPRNLLPSLHALTAPSGDQIRFVRAPPQPPTDQRTALGEHTDFGSITILFNRLGGLQILPPGCEQKNSSEWKYVRPLPGHCIVNFGDAMVKFTNGLLRSNIHRVVAPPGRQAGEIRYSVVYFSRPGDEVVLRGLEGDGGGIIPEVDGGGGGGEEGMTAKEWVLRRGVGRRVGRFEVGREGEWERGMGTERASARI